MELISGNQRAWHEQSDSHADKDNLKPKVAPEVDVASFGLGSIGQGK